MKRKRRRWQTYLRHFPNATRARRAAQILYHCPAPSCKRLVDEMERTENKMSILEHLYNGGLRPAEKIVPRKTDYRPMTNKIAEERDYFMGKLPEEDKDRFKEWNEMVSNCGNMTEYANFAYGFRLGAVITFEILMDEEME